MVQRTAILHIGTGKTGTTSIQQTLTQNRAELLAAGWVYPRVPGDVSHTRLAAYMQGNVVAGSGRKQLRAGPMDTFEDELRAELDALPDSVHTAVFSSEHCFNLGMEPGVVDIVRTLLAPMFDRFRIVVYLRRQDELAVSRLSTRLKAGRALASPFPIEDRGTTTYDLAAGIDPWVGTFGKEAVTPRIFSREELVEGDVVRDFVVTCGMPALTPAPAEANNSLSPSAQEFLRSLNQLPREHAAEALGTASDTEDEPLAARNRLQVWRPPSYLRTFLTDHFGGRGGLPSRAEAMAFQDKFAESNERIRAAFFPERTSLFSTNFDRYPETATAVSADDVLTVAVAVARMQSSMIAEMRASRSINAAEAAKAKGQRNLMVKSYLKALEYEPTNKFALRDLAANVENEAEAKMVRLFLATAPLTDKRKAAIEEDLAARFGGSAVQTKNDAIVNARVEARRAERKAQRRSEAEGSEKETAAAPS